MLRRALSDTEVSQLYKLGLNVARVNSSSESVLTAAQQRGPNLLDQEQLEGTRPKDKELERYIVGQWKMFSLETGKTTLNITMSSDHVVSTNSKPPTKGKWDVVGSEVRVIMGGKKYVVRQRNGKYLWGLLTGADWDGPSTVTRGFKKSR